MKLVSRRGINQDSKVSLRLIANRLDAGGEERTFCIPVAWLTL